MASNCLHVVIGGSARSSAFANSVSSQQLETLVVILPFVTNVTGTGEYRQDDGERLTNLRSIPTIRQYAASPTAVSVTTSPPHSSQSLGSCSITSSQNGPCRVSHDRRDLFSSSVNVWTASNTEVDGLTRRFTVFLWHWISRPKWRASLRIFNIRPTASRNSGTS